MAVLTGVYVIFGGYMATAINDFIQGIIMLVGIVLVVGAVLSSNGGFTEAVNKLSQIVGDAPAGFEGAYTAFLGPQPLYLLFVVILTSLGTWGLPQMIGKFYSIKDEDAVRKGTIISTVFAIIVAGGCYFLGGFGRLYDIKPTASGAIVYDSIIPTMLSTLSPIVIAVVIMLVLAASMSTLSSLVLTSASTLTLDLVVPFMRKKPDEKKTLFIMRIFIAFFILLSAAIAIIKDLNPTFTFIAQMMGVSWGALAGAFLAPFLYGLYSKKTTKASVVASFVFGVGLEVVQLFIMFGIIPMPDGFLGFVFTNPLYSGAFAMLGGLVIVPLVSLFTPKQDKAEVDAIFACYDKKVLVNATDALHSGEEVE